MVASAFVDTSGWYALIDRADSAHARAVAAVEKLIRGGARLVTTDYVLDEAYTLALMRSGSLAAARLLELVDRTAALDVERVDAERFNAAKALFRKLDQGFSFTDCTSFVVMTEGGMTEALTTNVHFRAAGFRALLRGRDSRA